MNDEEYLKQGEFQFKGDAKLCRYCNVKWGRHFGFKCPTGIFGGEGK